MPIDEAQCYDVSLDGQKFLMIKEPPETTDQNATPATMVVALSEREELKTRMPERR